VKDRQDDPQRGKCHQSNSTSKKVGIKLKWRWVCHVVANLFDAFVELTGREAIRVREWDVWGDQLGFSILERRSVAFIHNLI
jgi:hypothetical protein